MAKVTQSSVAVVGGDNRAETQFAAVKRFLFKQNLLARASRHRLLCVCRLKAGQAPGNRHCHASPRRVQAGSRACFWTLPERFSQQGEGQCLVEAVEKSSCDAPMRTPPQPQRSLADFPGFFDRSPDRAGSHVTGLKCCACQLF